MKKYLAMTTAAIAVLSLGACKKPAENASAPADNAMEAVADNAMDADNAVAENAMADANAVAENAMDENATDPHGSSGGH